MPRPSLDDIFNSTGSAPASDRPSLSDIFAAPQIEMQPGMDFPKTSFSNTQSSGESPNNAIEISPLTADDRTRMSFGNVRGSLEYLKSKFDDVKIDPEKGMVVQQAGKWHQVDPDFLGKGSPWERTKELAKDLGDLTGIAPVIMARAGAVALGTNPATIPAALGVGLAAHGVRTSLGRLFRTYKATPEEELADAGFESIFNMGAEQIALGAPPTIDMFKRAASRIGKIGSDASKSVLASIHGQASGTGEVGAKAALNLFEDPRAVTNLMKKIGQDVGPDASAETYIDQGKRFAIKKTEALLERASDQLPIEYGKLLGNLFEKSEARNLKVDMYGLSLRGAKAIEDAGLGKVNVGKGGAFEFVPFTQAEEVARRNAGQAVETIEPGAEKQISLLIDRLNSFAKHGEVEGRHGAKLVTNLQKQLNQISSKLFEGQQTDAFKRAAAQASAGYKQHLAEVFDNAGLNNEFGSLSQLYGRYKDSVDFAKQRLNSPNGPELFLNDMMSNAGKKITAKGIAGDLVELAGQEGEALYRDSINAATAAHFMRWAPKLSLSNTGAGVTLGLASAKAGLNPLFGAAYAGTASPRLLANTARIMQSTNDFVKTLGPKQLNELLKNPDLLGEVFRPAINSYGQEEMFKAQLLDQAGIGNE